MSSVPEAVLVLQRMTLKFASIIESTPTKSLYKSFTSFHLRLIFPTTQRSQLTETGTILEALNNDNDELSAAETEDEVFIQAGTGVVAKVTFPYIRKMIDLEDLLIVNEAKLILEPVNDSYDETFSLPRNLTLFETDKSNLPLTQIYADYNVTEVQKASISIDQEFDKTSGYVFTITQYMQSLLSTEGNLQRGLLITPLSDEINKGVERAYLNAGSGSAYRIKLKIWYTQKK